VHRLSPGDYLPLLAGFPCVVRGFGTLKSPQPEGGMMTVVHPIMFNPATKQNVDA
jgi:hypothetical protein